MSNQPSDNETAGGEEVEEVSFQRPWTIKNFAQISQNDELLTSQTLTLQTSQVPNTTCTWLFGFSFRTREIKPALYLYCELSDIQGRMGPAVPASLEIELLNPVGDSRIYSKQTKTFEIGERMERHSISKYTFPMWTFPDGSLKFIIKLTLLRHLSAQGPIKSTDEIIKALSSRSLDAMHDNMLELFSDEECCSCLMRRDLKIITSDGVELSGHKFILQMQNPVFASMLHSSLSASKIDIVKVDDVSGKTMGIILRYLYTGDLLPSWSDADVVVELTYAAGKYQLTEVLKFLDDTLGNDMRDEHSLCIMPLLSLASKLSLKNAEERLLEQFCQAAAKAKSAKELFVVVAGEGNNCNVSTSDTMEKPDERFLD